MKTILKVDLNAEYVREVLNDAAWAIEYAIGKLRDEAEAEGNDISGSYTICAWGKALNMATELRDQTDREG